MSTYKKTFNYCIIIIIFCQFSMQYLMAQEEIKSNLVSTDWLAEHLNDSDILIFDASFMKNYSEQHIPGAINTNLFLYGANEKSNAELEQLFQSWGISLEKKIVIYDQGGTFSATSLLFSLYYYGFPAENLFVLNGGLSKWQEKGFPVIKDIPLSTEKGTFTIKELNEGVRAKLTEFVSASGDPVNNALVEALTSDWHFGQTQFFDRPGHIPNAIMLPAVDFFNQDKTFKSAEEIQKMVSYMGIKDNQQIITHCGGGIAASVPFFALKFILNKPDVKLFMESQMGWLSDERKLPFWTYDAPFLMRESGWLQSWGGKMLRMYGVSQVSIIDIRSADEYAKGHLSYSLNIPADDFLSNINNTGNLSKILSSSGVNISYEAVIVSGAGLTKDAALVFAMLEKLGQKKVSVFMDSMDKWTQLGFPLTTDTTVVSTQKSFNPLAIPVMEYKGNSREDLIINDFNSTQGLYSKVLIASGKNVPSKVPDKKVIHIPYTEFINSDGTLKPAKDIWSILTKAEVPRYAELICFSDDPAESAANYFILKLMGYPDVKILLN